MRRIYASLLLCLLGLVSGRAQQFPVQASLQLKPPYSLYLADYTAPGTDKLTLNLLLKELDRADYQVRLRVLIEGAGITVSTAPNARFAPITLQGGLLQTLGSSELAPYLAPENLVFQGFSKQQYLKTHRLPEGIYQISFEVLDYYRNGAVSNRATVTAWFMLNDPPRFNTPRADQVVKAAFPQNVFFGWLPLHKNSPNAAFSTEYAFRLVEIYPIDRNPNDALLTTSPIYETVTENTSLVYDNTAPALIPGRRYAVRLRAKEKNGLDLFKNDGYSEVLAFTFGEECLAPKAIRVQAESPQRAKITWEGQPGQSRFTVRYREKKEGAEWFSREALVPHAAVTDLKPGTTYEYQVQAYCESVPGPYSTTSSFTTPQQPQSKHDLKCGYADAVVVPANHVLLPTASPGMKLRVGEFDLFLTKVTGSHGVFSGEGTIFVPLLYANVQVQFRNIWVNENRDVYDGEIRAASTGLALLSAAELAAMAQSDRKVLGKDICQPPDPEEEEEGKKVFGKGDLVLTLDSIPLYKGDTIVLNGQKVVVDENTKLKNGDVVVVNGKPIVVGGGNPNGTPADSAAAGAGASVPLPAELDRKVDDYTKDALVDLYRENNSAIRASKASITSLGNTILATLSEHKMLPEPVVGVGREFITEGMSGRIRIPAEDHSAGQLPVVQVYTTHRALYVADSTLTVQGRRADHIRTLIEERTVAGWKWVEGPGTQTFLADVRTALGRMPADSVTYYKNNLTPEFKAKVKAEVARVINERLRTSAARTRLGRIQPPDAATLVAYSPRRPSGEEHPSGNARPFFEAPDWFLPAPVKDTALVISPSVRAQALHRIIEENGRLVGKLSPDEPTDLPVGLVQQRGGLDYIIAIEHMTFTAKGAWLDAFMSMEVPFAERRIAFSASKVAFGLLGIKGAASVKMLLMKDVPLRVSNQVKLVVKGDNGGTFVEFDCEGFKSLTVSGEFEFCQNWIVPEGPDGEPVDTARVKARFSTSLSDWNDFIALAEIDPFQVKGRKGLGFYVSEMVVDMSDVNNPPSIVFPDDYQSPHFLEGDQNHWRGFYLRKASVKLPRQLKDKGKAGQRIELGVSNLIIDNMGVTGEVYGTNLISLGNGDMSGWAFSLDSIAVGVQANQFKYAGFSGDLQVPVFKDDKSLRYSALMHPNDEYFFSVGLNEALTMPMWAAEVTLAPASRIEIAVVKDKFLPKAILHGELNITTGGDTRTSLAGIAFEELTISTERPRVKIGTFSFGTGKKTSGFSSFPLTLTAIGARSDSDRVGLDFTVKLNLMKSDKEGFGADASLTVWGKMNESEGRHRWQYEKLEVSEIGINVKKPGAYELEGRLTFFRQDLTYGKGFRGKVNAKLGGIKVDAMALFGSTDSLRYWYADAMVVTPKGIPLVAPLALYGFGGGVYHHMRQKGYNEKVQSTLGVTTSGIVYLPDPATHLGLKASVVLGVQGKPEATNGDATFEISFNSRGGINQVGLMGNLYFVTGSFTAGAENVKAGAKSAASGGTGHAELKKDAPIYANAHILFDNTNDVFHADMKVFVNVANGMMKGVGENNLAGWAVMHFASDEWYVYIGSPANPVGVQLLGLAKTTSYLMAGDHLPGSPPPPDRVSQILGGIDLDYMREENALKSGKGFAFGLHFAVSTGDQQFLMFYGRFDAGAGLDIMLKDYGNARCEGRSGPLGINGWYANGQAYAYLEGKIGIRVKLKFYKGDFDILKIGAAAVLQAKGPNPFWMRGIVGGNYSILGGLVKGSCRFEVTVGEQCKIVTDNPMGDIEVIAEVTPGAGATDVSVFNAPQAVFNMPVDKPFEIVDMDDNHKFYRIKLDHFKLQDGAREIAARTEWNDNHDVLALNTYDVLPSQKPVKASVQVSFEEFTNGAWRPVTEKGARLAEKREVTFTTGIAPDYIPLENVAYSYPVINQYNFYKDESSNGYIKLVKGQPELFNVSNEWVQKGRFVSRSGKQHLFNVGYAGGQVNFTVPADLQTGQIYAFQVVNLPAQGIGAVDQNVDSLVTRVVSDNELMDTQVRTKQAEGTLSNLKEKNVFSTHFRTSRYASLGGKLGQTSVSGGWPRLLRPFVHELGVYLDNAECFDAFELKGITGRNAVAPLIGFEAKLSDVPWYRDYIYPLVYEGYPLNGTFHLKWRNPDLLGVVPVRAVYLQQMNGDRVLTEADVSRGSAGAITSYAVLKYNLPHYVEQDLVDLQGQVANAYASGAVPTERLRKLLAERFPRITEGTYPVDLKYQLPGTRQTTSMYGIQIGNYPTVIK